MSPFKPHFRKGKTLETHIFLDLDNVLADFTGGALTAHGWTIEQYREAGKPGTWYMPEPMGITLDQFWEPIHAMGVRFWKEIDVLPWAHELVATAASYTDQWFIVTAPSRDITSWTGKLEWLRRLFDDIEELTGDDQGTIHLDERCIPTPHKHLLAREGRVLIDDRERNIERFVRDPKTRKLTGGEGILFPALCNRLHHLADDPLPYVKQELEDFHARHR